MIDHIKSLISRTDTRDWASLSMILVILGSYAYFNYANQYYTFSVGLGLIFAPYVGRRSSKTTTSRRWLWVALGLGVLLCFRQSSSLFYFFCGFSVLYLFENQWGKLNNLPAYLLILMSTLASQTAYIWSFPIRLQLSEWSAGALSFAGWDAIAQGNVILMGGQEFSVDPACMGLSMLITGSLMALFILAYFERKHQLRFSLIQIALYLAGVFMLLVLANFTRLLALLVFKILPDSPAHDAVGLFSLVVYVLIPFYAYLAYTLQKSDKSLVHKEISSSIFKQSTFWPVSILILILLFGNGPKFKASWSVPDKFLTEVQLPGFQSSMVEGGILKLEHENALIYIKPSSKPFQGTHDPRICWRGTGYEFTHIEKRSIKGETVYTARLQKGKDELYTAWWFDSGEERTVEELYWRWSALTKGKQFRLINITTMEEKDLTDEILAFRSINLQQ